jgi:ribosome recycling factor
VPLQQVGSVGAPEPRLLVIQPWDKSLIKAICKGVNEANLGLNPTDDGSVVRIPIPTLTEERRKDLVKLISKFAEEGRVHIRQVRHDANKDLKHQEDAGTLPADDAKRQTADVQKMTDRYIALGRRDAEEEDGRGDGSLSCAARPETHCPRERRAP